MLRQHFNDREQYSFGSRCLWATSLGKQVILLGYIQQSQILDKRISKKSVGMVKNIYKQTELRW